MENILFFIRIAKSIPIKCFVNVHRKKHSWEEVNVYLVKVVMEWSYQWKKILEAGTALFLCLNQHSAASIHFRNAFSAHLWNQVGCSSMTVWERIKRFINDLLEQCSISSHLILKEKLQTYTADYINHTTYIEIILLKELVSIRR